jgi:hypothetical protein
MQLRGITILSLQNGMKNIVTTKRTISSKSPSSDRGNRSIVEGEYQNQFEELSPISHDDH